MLWARKPAVVFGSLIWVSMFALTAAADPSTDQAEPLEAPAATAFETALQGEVASPPAPESAAAFATEPEVPSGPSAASTVSAVEDLRPPEPDVLVPETVPSPVVFTETDRQRNAVAARLGDLEKLLPKLPRKEREALASFYGARGAATLWVDPNGWNAAAKSLIQRLTSADEDGLDPADYVLPAIAA